MAINQPPLTDDPVLNAWLLELTNTVNGIGGGGSTASIIARTRGLIAEDVEEFSLTFTPETDSEYQVPPSKLDHAPVREVITGTGLTFDAGTGQLGFSSSASIIGTVQLDTQCVTYEAGTNNYSFTEPIPDAHLVTVLGMTLLEGSSVNSRDYIIDPDNSNAIILQASATQNFVDPDDSDAEIEICLHSYSLSSNAQGVLQQFNIPIDAANWTTRVVDGVARTFLNFNLGSIPEAYSLYIGGMYVEETEYTISPNGDVTLNRQLTETDDLTAVLVYLNIVPN